jgi:hypothetical protein
MGSTSLRPNGLLITSRCYDPTDLPIGSTYRLEPGHPAPGWPTLLRPPIAQTPIWWYGNINPFPITYAFRPRLRGRLTLSGLTFLRKPWASGERVSHPLYRYSCQHNHFQSLQQSLRSAFSGDWNAPLPFIPPKRDKPAASVVYLSPVIFSARTHLTSELLRFL